MPRREPSAVDLYNRESEELRQRELKLSSMRDRAAQVLGAIVIEEGGAVLAPEQLRKLVRDAVAAFSVPDHNEVSQRRHVASRRGVASVLVPPVSGEASHAA